MTGLCPGLGTAWMEMVPADSKAAILSKLADVEAAFTKFDATADDRHTKAQMCR